MNELRRTFLKLTGQAFEWNRVRKNAATGVFEAVG